MVGAPLVRVVGAWIALPALAILMLLGASLSLSPPIVVVYPLTSTGAVDVSAGGNIALLLATKLGELGGVTVKPSTPGTERPKFLDAALALGADYYITGFLTPLGADNSLITQVVSTHSGSVVFSTTAVVRTYADAVAQADPIREAILRHAGRGLAALDAPPPAPSSSPAPDNASGVNITRALRKRPKATPLPRTPPPSPGPSGPANAASRGTTALPAAAASPPPAPGATHSAAPTIAAAPPASAAGAVLAARPGGSPALLFAPSGDVDAATRSFAARAVANALQRTGVTVATLGVAADANIAHAAAICAARPGTHGLYGMSLLLSHNQTGGRSVQLDLTAYDCSGVSLGRQRAIAQVGRTGGLDLAIDRAAVRVADGLSGRRKRRGR